MSGVLVEHSTWLDRLFAVNHRRLGPWYVPLWLLVSGCGIVFLAWPAQYFTELPLLAPEGVGPDAFGVAMVVGVVITLVTQIWAGTVMFSPVIRFARGEQVDPVAVWQAAVRRVPLVSVVCTASYCLLGNTAILAVIGPRNHYRPLTYLGAWLVMDLITAAAGFFFVLIWEVAYRPVLRELQPLLPEDFASSRAWVTLSRRNAIASASAAMYTAAATSSLVSGVDGRDSQLVVAVLATLGASLTFGGVITALVSNSIFMRVSEITTALLLLGRREYDVRVAVRAGDELDTAAVSLNRMARRLQADDDALRASRARLLSVADAERRRMERDLRHRVLARLHQLGRAVADLEAEVADRPALQPVCSQVRASIADAVLEIRRLSLGVYPSELTESGLRVALASAAERMPVETTLALEPIGRLEPELESAVYFCCTEALQNAAKHAPRARVMMTLAVIGDQLTFAVQDDGDGFDAGADGTGLANMRDRIRAVGGDVQIRSRPGVGTTVAGWVPVT